MASIIAIDGPVASGKSTVGELLAQRLGYRFLDTGSMYRGVAWLALCQGIALGDEGSLTTLAQQSSLYPTENGRGLVMGKKLLTAELYLPEVSQAASQVAKVPGVRRALVKRQQEMGRQGGIVMVGRDIGTDVLPHAPLKIFLTASPHERARRRNLEMDGGETNYQRVLQELMDRDRQDSQRQYSPLRPAEDAHVVNTDGMAIEEVVEKILALRDTSK